jgi:hypothetical protein
VTNNIVQLNRLVMLLTPVVLLVGTGCGPPPPQYNGEGTVSNTTMRHDGFVRIPEYTIVLSDLKLSSNFNREFQLGELSVFPTNSLALMLRFTDTHPWWRFSEFRPSQATEKDREPRDIGKIQSSLQYKLQTSLGLEVLGAEQPLKNFTWGQAELGNGSIRVDIYDSASIGASVAAGQSLKLSVSYSGDPAITNHAQLLLVCHKK